jgi:hypothetical protein
MNPSCRPVKRYWFVIRTPTFSYSKYQASLMCVLPEYWLILDQALIELHIKRLMEASPGSGLLRVAFPADVKAYNPEMGACCAENNFRVDFWGQLSSPWNQSCARIFARSFLSTYPEYESILPHGHRSVEMSWLVEFSALQSYLSAIVVPPAHPDSVNMDLVT